VTVVPDRDTWLTWARAKDIHPGVISYVESDPAIFNSPDDNPRSWEMVSDLLYAAASDRCAQEVLRETVAGVLAPSRAVAFLQSLNGDKPPLKADEILAYPRRRKQFRDWVKSGRLDLVHGSLLAIEKWLQVKRNYDQVRADWDRWKNLGLFLDDLPGDLYEKATAFFEEREYEPPPARKRT
jgi:hypothetical protein